MKKGAFWYRIFAEKTGKKEFREAFMTNQGKNAVDTLLAESFKELAEKQPIEKITIKEITDKAGVIRPTFYNHFQDKYELLEWIIKKEALEPMIPLLQHGMVEQALVLLFTTMEHGKNFYVRASKLEGQNSFESIIRNSLREILQHLLAGLGVSRSSKYKWLTTERIAEYYANSICYVIMTWIRTGMTVPPAEFAEVYVYTMKHSMEEIVGDMI